MQSYVEAMQPGWNLGNTLDAIPTETSWGNPLVTQEFIQQIADQGFKSIRIPVTWTDHTGPAPDYTIDPAWMDRVQQIVDWSLDAGLYVMINVHHDSWQWIHTMPANHDGVLHRFNTVWTQIANRFKDHSDKLMLESVNEPQFQGVNDATAISLLAELNTSFVNIVRSTGGGNATRPLVLPSLATNHAQDRLDSLYQTIQQLNDPNLIATIHYYGFWPFSVNVAGFTRFDAGSIADLHAAIDNASNTFVARGIPVVIGEFGLLAFDSSNGAAIERGEMLKFFEYFTSYAQANGVTHQWWDNGQHFNRATYQWRDPELFGIVMHSVSGRSSTAETDLIFLRSGTPVQDAVIRLNLNGNSLVSLHDGATTLVEGVDYTLAGDVLTVKAGALSGYASGALGEKAVLTANFSDGQPWKFRVRHHDVPALSAASGTKLGGLVIPVAFNGDLVATMEAVYVGGGNAGPHDWTSFKEYQHTYRPNYANNTVTITKEFFAATSNNAIDLKFHFWSGLVANYRLTFEAGGSVGGDAEELPIYTDALAANWNNWSWASVNTGSTAAVHSGSHAMSMDAGPWAAMFLAHTGPALTVPYRTLTFWANGGAVGGQRLSIGALVNWSGTGSSYLTNPLPANTWTKIEVPLDSLGLATLENFNGFTLMNASDSQAPTLYVDDVALTTAYASSIITVNGAPAPVITSGTSATGVFNAPFSFTVSAINNPLTFSATGLPPGLAIDANSGVISGTPTAAGLYSVTLTAANSAGNGTATLLLRIEPAPVAITFPGGGSPFGAAIKLSYDGSPKAVDVATTPAGIPVTITYNGSTTVPRLPGTYHVVVTSNDPNYAGSADGTLVITTTALVRQAPVLDGDVDGSIQVLSGRSFAINGSGSVSGDVLLPGTPMVRANGQPVLAGVVDESGASAPSDYSVTLNGGALVRYIVRRVDPIAMPVVTAPAAPSGTRDVTLNKPGQNPGSFATLRNLTLNANAGSVVVPPGVYGNVVVNGSSRLVLGIAGASEAAVYQLQGLTINGNATVQIVGPVTLKLARGAVFNGTVGSAEHPEWLDLQIASGGLTLNSNAIAYGIVTAPSGSVIINGELHGRVSADRLTINGNGLLSDPAD